MTDKESILGVVLCGGLSSRMGSDKGLLKLGDKFWAEIVTEKFQTAELNYVISINSTQIKNYHAAMGNFENFIVDNSNFEGPLKGLMSVHACHPEKNLIPLACDMLHFDSNFLSDLTKTFFNHPEFENVACKIKGEDFFEPFGAVYSSLVLKKHFANTQFHKTLSLQKILRAGKTFFLEIENPESFKNDNYPD